MLVDRIKVVMAEICLSRWVFEFDYTLFLLRYFKTNLKNPTDAMFDVAEKNVEF